MITSNGESDRIKLGEMAEAIKESLGNRIKKANWLDNSTRNSAIKKVGNSPISALPATTKFASTA
jgi:predicted metalloendopeptidase